jgi:hypothetical protein
MFILFLWKRTGQTIDQNFTFFNMIQKHQQLLLSQKVSESLNISNHHSKMHSKNEGDLCDFYNRLSVFCSKHVDVFF